MTRNRQTNVVLVAMLLMLLLQGGAVAWLADGNAALRRQVASLQRERETSTAELKAQITDLQRQVASLSADNQRLAQLVRDLGGNPDVHQDAAQARTPAPAPDRPATARTAPPRPPSARPSPSATPRPRPSPSPSPLCLLAVCL